MSLTENSSSLTVAENSLATAIVIPTPSDTSYTSAHLTVIVTALPSNGTVLVPDGTTPVSVGAADAAVIANQSTDTLRAQRDAPRVLLDETWLGRFG